MTCQCRQIMCGLLPPHPAHRLCLTWYVKRLRFVGTCHLSISFSISATISKPNIRPANITINVYPFYHVQGFFYLFVCVVMCAEPASLCVLSYTADAEQQACCYHVLSFLKQGWACVLIVVSVIILLTSLWLLRLPTLASFSKHPSKP